MTRRTPALALLLAAATMACSQPERQQPAPVVRDTGAQSISVPSTGWMRHDPAAIAQGRADASWRQFAEQDYAARRRPVAPSAAPTVAIPPTPSSGVTPSPMPSASPGVTPSAAGTEATELAALPIDRLRASGTSTPEPKPPAGKATPAGRETWDALSANALTAAPTLPLADDAAGATALRAQRLLDRAGFSPGVVDGHWGKNSVAAVFWLQGALGEPTTGKLDRALYDRLVSVVGNDTALRSYAVTAGDLQGPFVTIPDQPADQAKLSCLCYSSAAEELAERFHTTPELLEKLNPGVDLTHATAGATLMVPDVEPLAMPTDAGKRQPMTRIAKLVISKGGRYLQALDAEGNILLHFPATLGAGYDPSPDGNFRVTKIVFEPDFQYDPKLFAEVPDTEPEQHLPKGPNSPVGLVWMALSKEHYGIHGTAEPETIGYASSHGCVRMTNWDALALAARVPEGTPVEFRP